MKMLDEEKFAQQMNGLGELFEKKISPALIQIWWKIFESQEYQVIADAISRHVTNPDNGMFFPKPADIIRIISGSSLDAAYIAWTSVNKAVRTIGTYRSVIFEDKLIHVVLQAMGGWIFLGERTEQEWPFIEKEFLERYRGIRSRSAIPEHESILIGHVEADNRRLGYQVQEQPILISARDMDKQNRPKLLL